MFSLQFVSTMKSRGCVLVRRGCCKSRGCLLKRTLEMFRRLKDEDVQSDV